MRKKILIIFFMILISAFSLTGCKKEEIPEEIKQGEMSLDETHIISLLQENINKTLSETRSCCINTYKDELSSSTLYCEIKINKKSDFLYINNTYNGGIEEYYCNNFHYWKDKENKWYYDIPEISEEYNIKNFISLIENNYEKELLEDEIFNSINCYVLKVIIPTDNKEKIINYYVSKDEYSLVGTKENNLISLIDYSCDFEREEDLNNATRKNLNN